MNNLNMLNVKSDLQFGLAKEGHVLDLLQKTFPNPDIKNTKEQHGQFCIYDYESSDGTSWEVKSRRNKKTQYPTTILPVHKVREVDTKQYFVFHFTDKTCYIEYNKEQFDTFNKQRIFANRNTGSNNDGIHYEIPVRMLTDIGGWYGIVL